MRIRTAIIRAGIVGVCGSAAGVAHGQAPPDEYLAHKQANSDGTATGDGSRPTSPSVAVNNLGVVLAGNRFISVFDRTSPIGLLEARTVDTGFPFIPAGTGDTRFMDARTAHDPIHNRLWMAYVEGEFSESAQYCTDQAFLHVANTWASADFSIPGPLNQWHYITGPTPPPWPAFDLTSSYKAYKNLTGIHEPLEKTARMPSIGFHTPSGLADDREGGIVVAVNARTTESCLIYADDGPNGPPSISGLFQYIYVIPYEHAGGAESILDGDRPSTNDITVINPFLDLPSSFVVKDESIYGWVVQAPYEQPENATMIISTPEGTGVKASVRLKGVFYDDLATGIEWTLQQRTTAGSPPVLDDIDLDPAFYYRSTNAAGAYPFPVPEPTTPDTLLFWGPAAQGTYFHSAVMAKDVNGDMKIFAVHAVLPESTSDNRWVVQWYVIDPHLALFQSTTAGDWQPDIATYLVDEVEVKAVGRLEGEGHSYHPVIVVNRQGQAFIEYTYSDDETWPRVKRVRLNSSYTGVVGSPSLVLAGPPQPYEEDFSVSILGSWANVADAQADPFNSCAYWSTHTLVDELLDNVPDPKSEERDVWLFYQAYAGSVGPLCFQTTSMLDLNDDDTVDAYDLAEFSHLYDRRARRVDINGDGVVDAIDMALYLDAYDAATGP